MFNQQIKKYSFIVATTFSFFIAACTQKATEENAETTKKATVSCQFDMEDKTIAPSQETTGKLNCTLPAIYQGKKLTISYSPTFVTGVALDNQKAQDGGKLQIILPRKETFEGKVSLKGLKQGKTELELKILNFKKAFTLNIANTQNSGSGSGSGGSGGNQVSIAKPQPLTLIRLPHATVQIAWTTIPHATSYQLHFKLATSTTYTKVYEGGNTSYTHQNLQIGQTNNYILKACNSSNCSDFSDPQQIQIAAFEWKQKTNNAGWSGRWGHTSVVFNNKIWTLGGHTNPGRKNDVWSSKDGINWNDEGNASWSARWFYTSVVFNNKIWILGGHDGSRQNDVWSSQDGKTWTKEGNAVWSARQEHASVVFNNRIWVLGGYDSDPKNDIWSSPDGVYWKQETNNAAWSARQRHTSVVFNNRIWVLGGIDGKYRNDVWSSKDGRTWTNEGNADWSVRQQHTSVVFNNRIWVFGGMHDSVAFLNDVWSSQDGRTWKKEGNASWTARWRPASVVFNHRIWVLGGFDNISRQNDVWVFE